jgi:tetratricopeptide (TPR) repeat protein
MPEAISLEALQRSLVAEGRLDVLALDPFGIPEATELVERFLGRRATTAHDSTALGAEMDPVELAGRLHTYTGGNPLYLVSALETLEDMQRSAGGQPDLSSNLPTFDQGEGWPIPPRIRELLVRRLERATAPARDALRLAAVAGREFDLEVLEALWGKGEEETMRAVDDLLAARFIKESDRRGARDFAFSHHLLQESIYDGLPRHTRVRTHRRLAEVMESIYGTHAAAAELAFHYEQGGMVAKAVEHARAAANQAAAGYANDDARRWFSKAISLLSIEQEKATAETLPRIAAQRFALVEARLEVLRRIGIPREEEADIEELFSLARILNNERMTIEAHLGHANLLTRAGRHAAAEEAASKAVSGAETMAGGPEPIRLALHARALECLGNALLARDAYAEAILAFEGALGECRAIESRGESQSEEKNAAEAGEARVLDQLGWLYERRGDYPAARRFHMAALDLCRAHGDATGEAAALGHLGNVEWFVGDLNDAQRSYEAALNLHRRTGYRRGEGTTLRNLGLVFWRRGDLEQALDCHTRAMTIFEDLDDPVGILECHQSIGDVYFAVGALGEALRSYGKSLELAQHSGSSHSLAQSLFGSARTLRALGRPTEALVDVAQARVLCEAIGYPRGLAWCDLEAGMAESYLGNAGAAAALLRTAVDGFRALGELGLLSATRAELALVELAQGNLVEARALSDQATDGLRAGVMGLDQTQAIYFTRYRVLLACGDSEGAEAALAAAQDAIETQASRLNNPDLRAAFRDAAQANHADRKFQVDSTSS